MNLTPTAAALDAFSERDRATMLAVSCLPREARPIEVEHLAQTFRLVEQAGLDAAVRRAAQSAKHVERCAGIVYGKSIECGHIRG